MALGFIEAAPTEIASKLGLEKPDGEDVIVAASDGSGAMAPGAGTPGGPREGARVPSACPH